MLILAIGLQKSGSSWFFNLVNDVVIEGGDSDIREIRDRFEFTEFVKFQSCAVTDFSESNLARLVDGEVSNYKFAVKTHAKPNPALLEMVNSGKIKPLIIVRDPRDMLLSVIDAGKKLRERGVHERFGKIHSFNEALVYIESVIDTWHQWKTVPQLSAFKYESLIASPIDTIKEISEVLSYRLSDNQIEMIYNRYIPENIEKTGHGHLHFNKGVSGRYNSEMTDEQIAVCGKKFSSYMSELSYV